MSKLQKVQGLLNRLAAIRESWMDRRQEVQDVCGEVVDLLPEVIMTRTWVVGYDEIFKALHNALSDELRFLTTYPAQAPPEEPLLVLLDEIPDGMKFELGGTEIERCRRFSSFMVECKYAGAGPIFVNLPASFLVRPISMPDTEKSSYEVDPADLILPAKPTGPAEVELCNLTFGSKFELGGIDLHVVESGFGDTICCHYSNFIGARRELYLPSYLKVTPK